MLGVWFVGDACSTDTCIQKREQADLEKGCSAEAQKFAETEAEKRRRLIARWALRNAICLKRLEGETETVLRGPLPTPEWSSGIEKKLESMQISNNIPRRSRWDSLIAEEQSLDGVI